MRSVAASKQPYPSAAASEQASAPCRRSLPRLLLLLLLEGIGLRSRRAPEGLLLLLLLLLLRHIRTLSFKCNNFKQKWIREGQMVVMQPAEPRTEMLPTRSPRKALASMAAAAARRKDCQPALEIGAAVVSGNFRMD